MNVLITGGAGYIGTHTVPLLASVPEIENIVVYDNLSHARHGLFTGNPIANATIQFVRGDILDTRKLHNALQDIDIVVHLAAKVSTPFAHA